MTSCDLTHCYTLRIVRYTDGASVSQDTQGVAVCQAAGCPVYSDWHYLLPVNWHHLQNTPPFWDTEAIMQHTTTHCNSLQHTAAHWRTLTHLVRFWSTQKGTMCRTWTCHTLSDSNRQNSGYGGSFSEECTAVTRKDWLQHTATTHCNTELRLQKSTQQWQEQIDCNTLQHTALHDNTRQHPATPKQQTSSQAQKQARLIGRLNTQRLPRSLLSFPIHYIISIWLITKSLHTLLQCVAVCSGALQCVAVCCSALQCIAVCCSALQFVTVCCSALQRPWSTRTRLLIPQNLRISTSATHCNPLQHSSACPL